MKLFIILSVFCVIVLAKPESKDRKFDEAHMQCTREAAVHNSFKQDPKGLCIANCMLIKYKVISDEGKLDIAKYPVHLWKPVKACFVKYQKLEPCVRAIMFYKCTEKAVDTTWEARITKCAKESKAPITVTSKAGDWEKLTYEQKLCFTGCVLIDMQVLEKNIVLNLESINLYSGDYSAVNVDAAMEICNKRHLKTGSCKENAQIFMCVIKEVGKQSQ